MLTISNITRLGYILYITGVYIVVPVSWYGDQLEPTLVTYGAGLYVREGGIIVMKCSREHVENRHAVDSQAENDHHLHYVQSYTGDRAGL